MGEDKEKRRGVGGANTWLKVGGEDDYKEDWE